MKRWYGAWLAFGCAGALAPAAAVGACGSDGSTNDTAAGGAGAATTSSTGEGGSLVGCEPACGAGQFCSANGSCIDDGTCALDEDCGAGLVCDTATNTCIPGGGCGAMEVAVDPVPPNLLLVLDRSCSMRRDLQGNLNIAGPNKWTYSVDAINLMTTNYAGQIRFGLILFPDTTGGNCTQDAPAVPVGDNNETVIQQLLNAALSTNDVNYPDGPCVTNIDTAMEQASIEPAFSDPTRESYALLITDGAQAGCSAAGGNSGTLGIITSMASAGVNTFVLGFGGAVNTNWLGQFAVAGGEALMGTPPYYQADNAVQLDAALDSIANATLGCVFSLQDTPPDASKIFVFFNNDPNQVQQDPTHMNGWDYDPATNQIEFFGPMCDELKAGNVTDVDIVFGCPTTTPD